MARFPKKEAQIAALAEQLWRGLLDNNAIFSQPPVHPILIRIRKIIVSVQADLAKSAVGLINDGAGMPFK